MRNTDEDTKTANSKLDHQLRNIKSRTGLGLKFANLGLCWTFGCWSLRLMTFRTLIRRSLRFHWRSHLGVVLGAAMGSAALIGALVVGDSVRESSNIKRCVAYPERVLRNWIRAIACSGGDLLKRMIKTGVEAQRVMQTSR